MKKLILILIFLIPILCTTSCVQDDMEFTPCYVYILQDETTTKIDSFMLSSETTLENTCTDYSTKYLNQYGYTCTIWCKCN